MKKIMFVGVFVYLSALSLCAQKWNTGFLVVPMASSDGKSPCTLTTGLSLFTGFSTAKSYHNLLYSFGNNALLMLHGWQYTQDKNQDVYVVFGKNISSRGGYLGAGWEYGLTNGGFTAYPFVELGTNWDHCTSISYTIGVLLPFSKVLWKKY